MARLAVRDYAKARELLEQAITSRASGDPMPLLLIRRNSWADPVLEQPEWQLLRARLGGANQDVAGGELPRKHHVKQRAERTKFENRPSHPASASVRPAPLDIDDDSSDARVGCFARVEQTLETVSHHRLVLSPISAKPSRDGHGREETSTPSLA